MINPIFTILSVTAIFVTILLLVNKLVNKNKNEKRNISKQFILLLDIPLIVVLIY